MPKCEKESLKAKKYVRMNIDTTKLANKPKRKRYIIEKGTIILLLLPISVVLQSIIPIKDWWYCGTTFGIFVTFVVLCIYPPKKT